MKYKHPVSIRTQTILACIPYLNLVAFYSVKKFWIGLGLVIGINFGIGFPLGQILPFPYHLFIVVGVYLGIVIPLIKKWSIEWNKHFPSN